MPKSLVDAVARDGYAPHETAVSQAIAEDGCKPPSALFPISFEFMLFNARCRAMGFDQRQILELAKRLAERLELDL
ncbi:hypothetical protein [Mesorhizobium sp.]|uniref:hypothetical protein n=1 Tax=Mesorhizobium sp. TaxID=1871066 RepID=UPI001205D2F1|nr:hypothetical protein [Mesorhizobium sp.]TIQ42541.1 MAG: hypothetical protein E5X47_31830 [Mesorhizobium sp.]TIQ54852.1 MAG: hypothetical protein E5X46_25595 [Mesorhizobium sp.]